MVNTIPSIKKEVERRAISRLCHFTPSRNLGHIMDDPRGILASVHLNSDEKSVFNPTDSDRLDGYPNHVSCSIQYPNSWYFKQARDRETLYRDWVVLLIHNRYLWHVGTKFSQCNAATEGGRLIGVGIEKFNAMFEHTVEGTRTFTRSSLHPAFLPTDQQAEVLIPDQVFKKDVIGIAVENEAQARRELVRLSQLGVSQPKTIIVPEFFQPKKLSQLLRSGNEPAERVYSTE